MPGKAQCRLAAKIWARIFWGQTLVNSDLEEPRCKDIRAELYSFSAPITQYEV
jgi:hypothetical protein